MNRAYSLLEIKELDDDARVITGIASTPTADRMGDIVKPEGAVFKLPIPLLWQHDAGSPIGNVTKARVTRAGIEITAEIAKGVSTKIDDAWALIKAGLVRGLSIGFRGLDTEQIPNSWGIIFEKWEWLELSAVTIPANAEASITSVKQFDTEQRAASGNEVSDQVPGVTGSQDAQNAVQKQGKPVAQKKQTAATPTVNLLKKGQTMATLAEQIAALEAKRAANTARMEEVMQKGIDEGRSSDASEQEEFDTLEQEVKAIGEDLVRLRTLEKAKIASAKAVPAVESEEDGTKARAGVSIKQAEKLDKGIGFARYAQVLAAAKGDITLAKSIAENRFSGDDRLKTVFKAAVEAGTTTDPQWAGALVAHNELASDFIDFLRPRTIIGQFGVGSVPALRRVPFNVHIKGKTASGTAAWVGEGYAKPVTKSEYNDVYLGWAKVAAISVITEELARFSNPGAESLVRDDLAQAVIERIDTDFIDPSKAAGTGATASPASITNGVTAIPSTGTDGDSVRADIAALWAQADATNLPVTGAVYITDSRTARALSLLRNPLGQKEFADVTVAGGSIDGVPLIVSNYVPNTGGGSTFILAFAPEIFLADDGVVTLSASREAAIQMDDAPTHNSGTPTGASLVSMFQTNSIALRAERFINWAKRRAQAVSYLSGVNWGVASGS